VGHQRLEIAWTVAPLIVLAVVFALMVGTMTQIGASVQEGPATAPSMTMTARGYQWWWEFRYTGAAGEVVVPNDMHIPVGVSIDLQLQSADVVHSFWVPELGGKTDMIPGRTNHLRLYASRAGTYVGQCAEFCGVEHAWMRLRVVAEPQADFDRWLAAQAAASTDTTSAGARAFAGSVCASCHTVRGTSAQGAAGPDLTHVGSRGWLAAGVLPNDDESMRAWITDPHRVKPGVLMPAVPLAPADLDAVVAYLRSLR
jgi:cytochrome c oxidase subunit 2